LLWIKKAGHPIKKGSGEKIFVKAARFERKEVSI